MVWNKLATACLGTSLMIAGCTTTTPYLPTPAPQPIAAPAPKANPAPARRTKTAPKPQTKPVAKAKPAAQPVAQIYDGEVRPGYRKRRIMREGVVSPREQSIPVAYEVVPVEQGEEAEGPGAGGWN